MGRANNVSRSLQIISKAQGWDPTKITDGPELGPEAGYQEDRVIVGDYRTIGPANRDPQINPQPALEQREIPADTRGKDTNRTNGADPYPDMPGAR